MILDFKTQYNKKGGLEIIQSTFDKKNGKYNEEGEKKDYEEIEYTESVERKAVRKLVLDHFQEGHTNMWRPRREFNDLNLISRMTNDQMTFNSYQQNDGDGVEGDSDNWKSRAMRPIVRNKAISIAAHTTARLIFPKVFAWNEQSEEQQEAAMVMRELIEWSGDDSNYQMTALYSVIASLVNPVSITYTGFQESYREVKRERKDDGSYKTELVLDEDQSGFVDEVIQPDQVYISNFYENDVQKQDFIIWRRVQSYSLMETKYSKKYENFKYVSSGIQTIFDDANNSFYRVYDDNMRSNMCEEILYWNKSKDLFLIMVNGILLTEPDNPNPRNDKLYPFCWYGYELIDSGKFAYFKSLAFKLNQDSKLINKSYQMIEDGSYLNMFEPLAYTGEDEITSDVYVPASITTLNDPEGKFTRIGEKRDLASGFNAMAKVEESINESSQNPLVTPQSGKNPTAYEMALREKDRQTILGLFIQMVSDFVRQYGRLRVGDIIQYLTIGDVDKIIDNPGLVYKTFLIPERQVDGKSVTKKIKFDNEMEDEMTDEQALKESYKNLDVSDEKTALYRVNPKLFRNLKFILKVSPDVMNPLSEELERAYMLEEYDRAIQNPLVDQEKATKDFLLGAYPKSKSNPEEYMAKQQPLQQDNILDVIGAKKGGIVAPSENQLKAQPPRQIGI